jgi:glutamate transport system substrate-binding protein
VAESPEFEAGSTMAELADAGKITIGVKVDQPGIGFQEPGADAPTGIDIEMGRIIAAGLGIDADGIEWLETVSANREPFLQKGTVDIVIASYSITDERRALVGQAGPYYVTGQQLLVAEADKETITGPEDTEGKKVCSVTGSTSLQNMVDDYGSEPVPFATYSECVDQLLNGTVDAVTTDGAILLGYAAEDPDELEVVGDTFSEERYGIGYALGDTAMCEYITETIQAAMDDGTWAEAFEATLGQSGVDTPEPPAMDACS